MVLRKPAAPGPAARDSRHTPRPERAALVGLISGSVRRIDAEQSLEELAGLAEAAGAAVVLAAAASACASSGPAERHQHLRDAKQGPALPYAAADTRVPRKAAA